MINIVPIPVIIIIEEIINIITLGAVMAAISTTVLEASIPTRIVNKNPTINKNILSLIVIAEVGVA